MDKPLSGYRVLDMTHFQSGPSSTQLMAFLGADVIKLEPPKGDTTRRSGRDFPNMDSLYFALLNCNKRSLKVDLKTPEGKQILTQLIGKVDVLTENFGPGAMKRLGFPWEKIHEINPRVVLASVKGYGSEGPYSRFKAYESTAQAMGGVMSVTGDAGQPPALSGAALGDSGSGVHLLAGVLAALLQRERTGLGQQVEVAMMDCVLNLCRLRIMMHQQNENKYKLAVANGAPEEPGKSFAVARKGNANHGTRNVGSTIRCAPGGPNDYVYLYIVGEGDYWKDFCKAIGRPDIVDDPRFATHGKRHQNQYELFAVIEESYTLKHTKQELLEFFNGIGNPCGAVMDTGDLIKDAHLKQRDMIVDVPHPQRGSFVNVGCPMKLSGSKVEITAPPLLGEHSEQVLGELLGYPAGQIDELKQKGVI